MPSITVAREGTIPGAILGTIGYLSPNKHRAGLPTLGPTSSHLVPSFMRWQQDSPLFPEAAQWRPCLQFYGTTHHRLTKFGRKHLLPCNLS